ncbi:acyl-CoA carboxylase subunit epsilon [Streptomyces sp. NPDC006134]|uniref:acyl-CoA carboxylase subunit epsilon n=1 Tax=Streptomyces sp. NPDC006134 TaxID=3154467 RepID=UPI0033EE9750
MSRQVRTDAVVRVERGGPDEEELAAVCALLSLLARRAERQDPGPRPPAARGWRDQEKAPYRAPLSWR